MILVYRLLLSQPSCTWQLLASNNKERIIGKNSYHRINFNLSCFPSRSSSLILRFGFWTNAAFSLTVKLFYSEMLQWISNGDSQDDA